MSSSTMHALVLQAHGEFDQFRLVTDRAIPRADPHHVVIRVGASAFNYHDLFTMRGMPGVKVPLPVIVGLDMAGDITEIGPEVTGWSVGDRVLVNPLNPGVGLMGEMLDGGMAQYCRVHASQLIPLPDEVTHEQAAALPVAYGTAHRMLITHNTVKAGDKVLILGASGGVGTAAVVLAKRLGAEVIACTSSADKGERLKAIGADHIVNTRETNFSKWAIQTFGKPQRRTYEGGVDVIVNFTGGDTWLPSLKCIKRGGTILVCGATAGYDPKEDLRYIWSFEINVKGSNSFYDENLRDLLDLVQQGQIDPVIDRAVPLDEALQGLEALNAREIIGKIVVTPNAPL